ncbi:MAG: hypothetical protein JRI23_17230 [Deltaproteobacteria bacterium]|jgi:hypothetical protein|nr:hypothetical protein [Deltaproteobacteria bacterium]MBW2533562.1 hypothetical protein [Deltaproteobacteria bacterium]
MRRWIGLMIGLGVGAALASGGCDDEETATPTAVGGGGLVADAGSISGLALINPTCGVGDGGTVSQDCVQCATDHCSAEFEACFDSSWGTTLAGGICTTFGQCVMDCDCGDNECFNVCLQQLDAATGDPCRACVVDLVVCEQAHCDTECETNTGNDAGTGGSTHQGGGTGQQGGGTGHQGGQGHGR